MVAHQRTEQNGLDFEQAMQRPIEMAKEYPVASMLVVFGVGLGVGILLGQAAPSMSSASSNSSSSWMDSASRGFDSASRYVDSASRYVDSAHLEKFGQQVCNAIMNALPSTLAKSFQG